MENKTIAIGCDHAGYPYKAQVITLLEAQGYEVFDKGTSGPDSVDYPDFAHPVAQAVTNGQASRGIVMCGSGNGVAMTVNKYEGIRAALCWTKELSELARQHNDANILAVPVRFVSEDVAKAMVQAFVDTDFEGGRHGRRVNKISDCSAQ